MPRSRGGCARSIIVKKLDILNIIEGHALYSLNNRSEVRLTSVKRSVGVTDVFSQYGDCHECHLTLAAIFNIN